MLVKVDDYNEIRDFIMKKLEETGMNIMDVETVLVAFENKIRDLIYKEIQFEMVDKRRGLINVIKPFEDVSKKNNGGKI